MNYLTVLVIYAIRNLYKTAFNIHQCTLVYLTEFATDFQKNCYKFPNIQKTFLF